MPYPEEVIRPMREELTRLGVQELRTPEAVDETLKDSKGTIMVVVNSICGCAAGKARPGIAMALTKSPPCLPEATSKPLKERVVTLPALVHLRPQSGF